MVKKTEVEVEAVQEVKAADGFVHFSTRSPEVGEPIKVQFGNGNIFEGSALMSGLGYVVDAPKAEMEDYQTGLLAWKGRKPRG